MFESLKTRPLFGIDLYVHGTFWLLPLFVLLSGDHDVRHRDGRCSTSA